MRVGYLLQTHRDPLQIARLVATLGRMSPRALVLVAHDASGCELDPRTLRGAAEVRHLTVAGPVRRGYLSMLEPYFQAVELLRRETIDYDWLVYLSGQDYPTQPLARTEARLAASDADGFLRFWPALGPQAAWGRRRQGFLRYYYRYRDAPPWSTPLLRLLKALNGLQSLVHVHRVYGRRVGVRARRTPFDAGRVCYGGWQWTTLRRACAESILDAARGGEPELLEHFRCTICPDEAWAQTVLVNAGRFRLVDDSRRYADTSKSRDGRPRLLGVGDLDLITSGAYDFARKFDPAHDPRVLDLLDERLAGG
jgi:hypothetical protein